MTIGKNIQRIRRRLRPFEKEVLDALQKAGLKPYVYVAASSGSCYIKFANQQLLSLRIADHNGGPKYRYKWNLRKDITKSKTAIDRGVIRYYYPSDEYEKMITDMQQYGKE